MTTHKCQMCGVILEPGLRRCPRCGSTVQVITGARRRRFSDVLVKPLWQLSIALVLVCVVLLWVRRYGTALFSATSPVQAEAAPQAWIWTTLRREYPELRVTWQDAGGMNYVAVPQILSDSMLRSDRRRFAAELDRLFAGQRWTVVTGRYRGGSQIMMDTLLSREQFLDSGAAGPAPAAGGGQPPEEPPPAAVPPGGPAKPSPPQAAVPAKRRPSNVAPGVPDYEVLFSIDAFGNDRRYGEILVPSLSPRTLPGERRRIAEAIAQLEQLDDLTLYCTREAREAHYSMDFAETHPRALDQGLLGSLERGRFRVHRPGG